MSLGIYFDYFLNLKAEGQESPLPDIPSSWGNMGKIAEARLRALSTEDIADALGGGVKNEGNGKQNEEKDTDLESEDSKPVAGLGSVHAQPAAEATQEQHKKDFVKKEQSAPSVAEEENSAASVAKAKPQKKKGRIQAMTDLTKEDPPDAQPEHSAWTGGSCHVFSIVLSYLSEFSLHFFVSGICRHIFRFCNLQFVIFENWGFLCVCFAISLKSNL